MRSLLRYTLIISAVVAVCHGAGAEALANDAQDATDKHTRINPQLGRPEAEPVEIVDYAFINRQDNRIKMNGADWHGLIHKFESIGQSGASGVNIVHIGDSHIQADGNTGRVRTHLQSIYGNGGRGLMAPLRIAGTNQPVDYSLSTTGSVSTATLLKLPWRVEMGFTGVAVKPTAGQATFKLTDKSAFNTLRIYANGPVKVHDVSTDGVAIPFTFESEEWGAQVRFDKQVCAISVRLSGANMIVYGFDARDTETVGVVYHAIGNNGATFATYSRISGFGKGIALLEPDLVVLSLGSNEAFGKITDADFYKQIDALIKIILAENPEAKILLTTPSECQRSVYTTTRSRKGRKRRRVRRTRSYQVNANVERLRNVILKYGEENQIPTYDFYAVAGGSGASAKWLQKGLMSADRIHRTWNGYYLEGNLIYNALLHTITGKEAEPIAVAAEAKAAVPEASEKAPETTVSDKKTVSSKKKTTVKKKKTTKKKKTRRSKTKRRKRR